MTRVRRNIRRRSLGLGLLISAVGCVLFVGGFFDRLNWFGFDLHARYCGSLEADSRIVVVGIDDQSLASVGAWPWPRRRHAQLVRTLHSLGARSIVLDIVFSEPTDPRVTHAGLDPDQVVNTQATEAGDRAGDAVIHDDSELAQAIAEAGNVYLAMLFDSLTKPSDPTDRSPKVSQLDAELERDFGLDEAVLTTRLQISDDAGRRWMAEHFPGAKRRAADRAAANYFSRSVQRSFADFLSTTLPKTRPDALSADRADLLTAYRKREVLEVVLASNPKSKAWPNDFAAADGATPPLTKLARGAKGVGFVTFERERTGGILRELPLLADFEGRAIPQLGFLAAADFLGADRAGVLVGRTVQRAGGRELRLARDASTSFPVNEQGATLIHWHAPKAKEGWASGFAQVPVTSLLALALNEEAIADNERRYAIAKADLMKTRHAETRAEYQRYVALVNERLELQRQAASGSSDRRKWLDQQIQEMEGESLIWLSRVWDLFKDEKPTDEAGLNEQQRIRNFHEDLAEGGLRQRLDQANQRLRERNDGLVRSLRPRIEGKICLVGYTASAVADLVTTPVHGAMPGVMAHANVINMILQNSSVTQAARWMDVFFILIGGCLVTWLTARCRSGVALTGLVVAVAVFLAGGALLYGAVAWHLASLVMAVIATAAWAATTLYRQLVAERGRRQFQKALAQYTSPAIADRIAEDQEATLAPQPAVVTCFFADLVGFTPLSERLGPYRTRLVLNPFLTEMSRVLIENDALVNKFVGDGVFAFFNAPIWPCRDHAAGACRAALAARSALSMLNRQHLETLKPDSLAVRIGISTGEAFVGDYGSDSKLDYTCIGDTVNVGSRIEQANRALGTVILVDEATRTAAGSEFLFRRLGTFRVSGKASPIEIAELLDSADRADAGTREYAARFEALVEAFQHCQGELCRKLLAECRRLRGHDAVLDRYDAELMRLHNEGHALDQALPLVI